MQVTVFYHVELNPLLKSTICLPCSPVIGVSKMPSNHLKADTLSSWDKPLSDRQRNKVEWLQREKSDWHFDFK